MLRYFKGSPEDFVIRYRDGQVSASGRGISFWYWSYNTNIAVVPVTTLDSPFIFAEATSDFQELAIQGSIAYRITDPLKAAESYDFSNTKTADGQEKIADRLILTIQGHARRVVSRMTLEQALAAATTLGDDLTRELADDPIVAAAGLAIQSVQVSSVRPAPEIQQALQTEYREALQRQADQAIFARRAHALEKEREIKEREVATEIELAERRKTLIDTEARNKLKLAEASVKAQEMELAVYNSVPANIVTALALKGWAEKGAPIGNLSITPDMLTAALAQLANPPPAGSEPKPETKPGKPSVRSAIK